MQFTEISHDSESAEMSSAEAYKGKLTLLKKTTTKNIDFVNY